MSFIDDILSGFGLETSILPPPYRAVIIGGRAGYFEGVKGIKSYEKEQVIFYLKKGSVRITGKNLSIKKISGGDAVILGDISAFETES